MGWCRLVAVFLARSHPSLVAGHHPDVCGLGLGLPFAEAAGNFFRTVTCGEEIILTGGWLKFPGTVYFSIGATISTEDKTTNEINKAAQTWIENEITLIDLY